MSCIQAGCDYPASECSGACMPQPSALQQPMRRPPPPITVDCPAATVTAAAPVSALDVQEGGDHYKKLGDYQPWEVLKRWLTPEEFRGYMKGTAIAYLARERDKGGMLDIRKAAHTLQGLAEMAGDDNGS